MQLKRANGVANNICMLQHNVLKRRNMLHMHRLWLIYICICMDVPFFREMQNIEPEQATKCIRNTLEAEVKGRGREKSTKAYIHAHIHTYIHT